MKKLALGILAMKFSSYEYFKAKLKLLVVDFFAKRQAWRANKKQWRFVIKIKIRSLKPCKKLKNMKKLSICKKKLTVEEKNYELFFTL